MGRIDDVMNTYAADALKEHVSPKAHECALESCKAFDELIKTIDKMYVLLNCIADGNTKRNQRLTGIEKQLKEIRSMFP